MNLVCNSAKFVQKGFICMRAEVDDDNQVLLYVEDSGPGIKPENRGGIFCKYQQSCKCMDVPFCILTKARGLPD